MTELPEGYNPTDKNEALELWQELFDGGLNPMVAGFRSAGCFFGCGAILPEDHKPGCIYLRAKALIEAAP